MAHPLSNSENRYSMVVAALASRPGVSVSSMRKKGFGSRALCIDSRIFAMLSARAELVVKLPRDRVAALVAAGSGAHFEIKHGRPMNEWFVAGIQMQDSWLPLVEEALIFAGARDGH